MEGNMVQLLVYLVIIVVVVIFLFWLMQQVPLPPPLQKIATIVLVAIGVIVLIGLLIQFSGGGSLHIPRLQ
jgi:heme A synthase